MANDPRELERIRAKLRAHDATVEPLTDEEMAQAEYDDYVDACYDATPEGRWEIVEQQADFAAHLVAIWFAARFVS